MKSSLLGLCLLLVCVQLVFRYCSCSQSSVVVFRERGGGILAEPKKQAWLLAV